MLIRFFERLFKRSRVQNAVKPLGSPSVSSAGPAAIAPAVDSTGFLVYLDLADNAMRRQDFAQAIEHYNDALSLDARSSVALNNLGVAYKVQGKYLAARREFQRAVHCDHDAPDPWFNLGDTYYHRGELDEAIEYYRSAISLKPDYGDALIHLADCYQQLGMGEEAQKTFDLAYAATGADSIKVLRAMVLPPIVPSPQAIDEIRGNYDAALDALHTQAIWIDDPPLDVPIIPFYLSYYGRNDVALQRKLARVFAAACPALDYTAPHCLEKQRPSGEKIRLGVVSPLLISQSVGVAMRGIVAGISRDRFSLHVFGPGTDGSDPVAAFYRDNADTYRVLPAALGEARSMIAEQALDILLYPDLGSVPLTYFLAFARLAPVQCATWGHPCTSGIGNIDYFVSTEDLEPENAERHYSERLARLADCAVYPGFRNPTLVSVPKPRSAFGLNHADHIYICPQSLFKLHPDFDLALATILRNDPQGRIVLFDESTLHWKQQLLARFGRSMPEVLERVNFLKRVSHEDLLNLIFLSNVMLDPFPVSGGITTHDGLAAAAPIVTWPGELMRGRFTYACYKRMGIMDCVAGSITEYCDIALRLGTDAEFRNKVSSRIMERNHVLFDDRAGICAWEEFLTKAARGKADPVKS